MEAYNTEQKAQKAGVLQKLSEPKSLGEALAQFDAATKQALSGRKTDLTDAQKADAVFATANLALLARKEGNQQQQDLAVALMNKIDTQSLNQKGMHESIAHLEGIINEGGQANPFLKTVPKKIA